MTFWINHCVFLTCNLLNNYCLCEARGRVTLLWKQRLWEDESTFIVHLSEKKLLFLIIIRVLGATLVYPSGCWVRSGATPPIGFQYIIEHTHILLLHNNVRDSQLEQHCGAAASTAASRLLSSLLYLSGFSPGIPDSSQGPQTQTAGWFSERCIWWLKIWGRILEFKLFPFFVPFQHKYLSYEFLKKMFF